MSVGARWPGSVPRYHSCACGVFGVCVCVSKAGVAVECWVGRLVRETAKINARNLKLLMWLRQATGNLWRECKKLQTYSSRCWWHEAPFDVVLGIALLRLCGWHVAAHVPGTGGSYVSADSELELPWRLGTWRGAEWNLQLQSSARLRGESYAPGLRA